MGYALAYSSNGTLTMVVMPCDLCENQYKKIQKMRNK
jgi:hypothetical protein